MAEEFSYNIEKKIGVVSEGNGWNLELNMVSWAGKPARYDLRRWRSDHQSMRKGVTLSKGDLADLKALLNKLDLNSLESA